MRVQPALTQTTAANISPGSLCVAKTNAGSGGLFLRLAGGGTDTVAVVQIAPRSTELNWLNSLDPATVVCDVTGALALAYSLEPSNLRFPTLNDLGALVAGDLLVDGQTTKLVCVGPNPASGIGFVDLATGEISSAIGPNPMLVLSWALVPAAGPTA